MPEINEFTRDLQSIGAITSIPLILDIISRSTGMGYATVARVTEDRWIACAVLDKIGFGLDVGGELKVDTTLCHEVNQHRQPVVIDDVPNDPVYVDHHTPAIYGLKSYIAVPIILKDGRFFGTLCAIDPNPAKINNPATIGMFNLYAELIAKHLDNFEQTETFRAELLLEQEIAGLREQFIAVLGHDLRNPISAVRNVGQLMRRGLDEKSGERFSKILLNSSQRMLGLIDNLADFARGRLGAGMALHLETMNLTQTLVHVIEELKLIFPEVDIDIDIACNQPVIADSKRIAQLFSNLLSNSIHHGKQDMPVTVSSYTTEGHFHLRVDNYAEPISEEKRNAIFQPFSRGSGEKHQEGLGLGLYISSEIARAHGGTLSTSYGNAQITFKFEMPLQGIAAPTITNS